MTQARASSEPRKDIEQNDLQRRDCQNHSVPAPSVTTNVAGSFSSFSFSNSDGEGHGQEMLKNQRHCST